MTGMTSTPTVSKGEALRVLQARLHRRLAAGDELALLELYDLVAGIVFCAAFGLTGSRSTASAQTEALFVELWRAPHTFAPANGPLGLQMIRRLVEQAPPADRAA